MVSLDLYQFLIAFDLNFDYNLVKKKSTNAPKKIKTIFLGGGVPSILQEVQVPIMENNVCQEMFHTAGHSKTILQSFICAGYANGQRDSCEVVMIQIFF